MRFRSHRKKLYRLQSIAIELQQKEVPVLRIVSINDGNSCRLAIEESAHYHLLPESDSLPSTMKGLIDRWGEIDSLLASVNADPIPFESATLAAPITDPDKVICIGKNYASHAREMGSQPPSIPVVFSKFSSAIIGPHSLIQLPAISQKVDYEAELVVVIGKRGKHIRRDDAMSYVFGYCCGNDVSARDWQKEKPGGQWLLGKTFDTFAPIGPRIVTCDEVEDPHDLQISMRLNGEVVQHSNTQNLIFRVDYLISHLSNFVTLEPGDLIFTGTPEGVGAGRKPPVFLKDGDHLEVTIEKIGTLSNKVVRRDES